MHPQTLTVEHAYKARQHDGRPKSTHNVRVDQDEWQHGHERGRDALYGRPAGVRVQFSEPKILRSVF